MGIRRILVLIAAVATGLLTACGPSTDPLDGRTFVSTEVAGHDLVPGTRITLTFSSGNVGADAGCNHMGGAYTVDGDTLQVGILSMTEMACSPTTKMDQDQWLAALLTSGPSFLLSGQTLTLTSGQVSIMLAEQITNDLPLEGTRWELQSIVTGSGPDSTVEDAKLATDPATLTISNELVAFSGGVNVGSGPATVSDGTIMFGHLMVSLRAVPDDRRGHIDGVVFSVIQGTVKYDIEGDVLTVTAEDGSHGLIYRAVTATTESQ